MTTSLSTTSIPPCLQRARPLPPSRATSTSKPSDSSNQASSCACVALSSTTRILVMFPLTRPMCPDQSDEPARDHVERQHGVGGSCGDGLARHAEHHGGLLVLRDHGCTSAMHRDQAGHAVAAHAGEDEAERIFAEVLRDGLEEV